MNSIITNNINIVVWALFAVSILVLFSPFYLLSDRNSDSDMLTLPGWYCIRRAARQFNCNTFLFRFRINTHHSKL